MVPCVAGIAAQPHGLPGGLKLAGPIGRGAMLPAKHAAGRACCLRGPIAPRLYFRSTLSFLVRNC